LPVRVEITDASTESGAFGTRLRDRQALQRKNPRAAATRGVARTIKSSPSGRPNKPDDSTAIVSAAE